MAAKISLSMIVRNEGKTLRACLDSVLPYVDEAIVLMAGESTDDTAEILRSYPKVRVIAPFNWNDSFADARNASLSFVTGDYLLWLDGDDVLVNGDQLQSLIRLHPNVDLFYMGYDYSRDPQSGKNNCFLIRERLLRNPKRWTWKGRIHEVLVPEDGWEPRALQTSEVMVEHHKPQGKHNPDRNLQLLYRDLDEGEPNPEPRVLNYLGAECAVRGKPREAISHWNRFIQVSGWDEEKYQAQHHIADAWKQMGDLKKALIADYNAITMMADWPDAYFGLAETYFLLGNFKACIAMTEMGSSRQKPSTLLVTNPFDYTYNPALILASAYAHMGDLEMALLNYKKAYELRKDPGVWAQIKEVENELDHQHAAQAFLELRNFLGRHDEWIKARTLFSCVPKLIQKSPMIMEAQRRTAAQTAHIDDPQLITDFYRNNPGWVPAPEEMIWDPMAGTYPRIKFALEVARRIQARTIIDWGCSDGFITMPLARELGNVPVFGIDIDERCVNKANERATERGVNATFFVGDVLKPSFDRTGVKHDLALLFEVIEHVVNPAEVLAGLEKTANHIAITTPYLSWEQGRWPEWDKEELKGHIRIFDEDDMEVLLTPRGRIWNLHRLPFGDQPGWLVADYSVGQKTDKNIVIGAPGTLETWSPRTVRENGMGGSETAIVQLGESMAAGGHRVTVYTRVSDPGYYNGVCFRDQENFQPEISSDLFIAWRWPEAAEVGIRTRHLVLWMHDTDAGDRLTPARAAGFEKIVVLSEWHKNHMLEVYPFLNPDKLVIIPNGVDPARFQMDVEKDPNRVFYSSSPDRGLDVILESIWPKVTEKNPNAELHVYYGWDSFDRAAELYPHLRAFKAHIMDLISKNKNIFLHGRIPQDQLAKEMMKSSVWLYPTYFDETYCITAVEAQMAGALPVTNRRAALAEVVKSGAIIEGDVTDPKVQQTYVEAVLAATLGYQDELDIAQLVREHAPQWSWVDAMNAWLCFL